MLNSLQVFHWNINGLNNCPAGLLEFKQFISDNSFDIICLNEAHSTSLNILDYQTISCSPDLSVFIRKNIQFQVILNQNINNAFEVIAVKVSSLLFILCYLRDGKRKDGMSHLIELILSLSQTHRNIIILGDLNARMLQLGNSASNAAGRTLENFLSCYDNFLCHNEPNRYTFEKVFLLPNYRKVQSILDLCISSIEASQFITGLNVIPNLKSDHFPLVLDIELAETFLRNSLSHAEALYPLRSKNLQFIKQFPASFKETLDDELENRVYSPHIFDSTELWKKMEQCIYESLKKENLIKKKKPQKRIRPLPIEIYSLRSSNRAEFKKQAKIFRRQQWLTFVESIDSDMDQASIWRKFNNSLGKKRTPVKHGDADAEVEKIRDLFQANSSPEIPAQYSKSSLPESKDNFNINYLFTKKELSEVLSSLGNSSPGPDGIPYNVFKQFSDYSQSFLLCFLNKLYVSGMIPSSLKQCIQVAFPKSTPGDYRPITLMNCILKIFEALIYRRLYPILDPFLPVQQYGFRKLRSSSDQAANLIMHIQGARSQNLFCGVIFIDIKKAFDRIDRTILISDLASFGISGNTLNSIRSLIIDNRYRVIFEDAVSSEYSTEAGCPQGSILSPLLWNFYFREVGSLLDPKMTFLFADDLAIFYADRSHRKMISTLTGAFKTFNEWCYSKRIEVSASKTKFMDCSKPFKKRKLSNSPYDSIIRYKCLLSGTIGSIETVDHYKYLGVTIDSNLSFNKYVSEIVDEVKNRTSLIRRISQTVKLCRENIEKFYQGYVRGYLQYGSAIWSTFNAEQIKKIEIIDRKGLSLCIGALIRTRNEEIEKESTLPSLEYVWKRSQLRLGCRVLHTNELIPLRENVMELAEISSLASSWIHIWSHFELPRAPNINVAYMYVSTRLSKPPKDYTKYFRDFWKERILARIRMNNLPTREWAHSVRLAESPLCRHCGVLTETCNHLFNECLSLDFTPLEEFYYTSSIVSSTLTFTAIRSILLSPCTSDRIQLQEAIFSFIKLNQLFKRG
jgi:hypothetical protein